MNDREPTMTLVVDGDVPLDLFAKSIEEFRDLVSALDEEVGAGPITWVVADLSIGSTSMTVRGETNRLENAWGVVAAYSIVGAALAEGREIPFSEKVATPARAITSIINGRIPSIRFETEDDIALVTARKVESFATNSVAAGVSEAYGSVEGTIQTASTRRGLRFTIYDSLYDRAVSCYLRSDQEELVRDAWGHRAIVRGRLTRDARTGRPLKISQVEGIEVLPLVESGAFRRAKGVLAGLRGSEPPEITLRRLRDAW